MPENAQALPAKGTFRSGCSCRVPEAREIPSMASDGVDARNRSRSPVRAPDAETSGLDGTVNVPVLPGGSLPEGAIPIPDETPLAPGGNKRRTGLGCDSTEFGCDSNRSCRTRSLEGPAREVFCGSSKACHSSLRQPWTAMVTITTSCVMK